MFKALALSLASALALASAPAVAQSQGPVSPGGLAAAEWQGVIHNQLQAFRDLDASGAFSYSASSFHTAFKSPEDFFVTIANAGYAPLMDTQSETFGSYDLVNPDVVFQDVKFSGKDNQYYEAVYGLTREAGGWRVEAVVVTKMPGVGI